MSLSPKSLPLIGALALSLVGLTACSGIAHSPEIAAPPAPTSDVPEIVNWNSLRVTLQRHSAYLCAGCVPYKLEIRGDGRVTFQLLVPEQPSRARSARISRTAVREVYRQFRRVRFFELKERPISGNCLAATTTLAFDGFRKTIQDCSGVMAYLDGVIDRAVRVNRWITLQNPAPDGYAMAMSGLVPALVREADLSVLRDVLADGEPVSGGAAAMGCWAVNNAVQRARLGDNDNRIAQAMIRELISHGAALHWQVEPLPAQPSNYDGCSPLAAAAFSGQADIVELLLAHNDDPNWADVHLGTPLMAAASTIRAGRPYSDVTESDYLRIGRALLAAGANVNPRERRFGGTPVMSAFYSAAFARLLIDNGADVSARRSDGGTALHSAVRADVFRVLLEAGADPRAKDAKGNTVLMRAIPDELVQGLVDAGADVNGVNQDGETALSLSRSPELGQALLQAGASPWLASGEVHPSIRADCIEERDREGAERGSSPTRKRLRCAPILDRIARGRDAPPVITAPVRASIPPASSANDSYRIGEFFACPAGIRSTSPELGTRIECVALEYVQYQGQRVALLLVNWRLVSYGDTSGFSEKAYFIAYPDGRFERNDSLADIVRAPLSRYRFFIETIGADSFWRNNLNAERVFESELVIENTRTCIVSRLQSPYNGTISHCVGGEPMGTVREDTGVLSLASAVELARAALEAEIGERPLRPAFPVADRFSNGTRQVTAGRPNSHVMYLTNAAGRPYWIFTYGARHLVRVFFDRTTEVSSFPTNQGWTFENVW